MNRERVIMAVLYDMAMVIGGEVNLEPLLTRTLQRLLYHTSFPAGAVFLNLPPADDGETVSARLELALGDFELARHRGEALPLPAALVEGPASLVEDPALIGALPCRPRRYGVCLRLPVGARGVILLLAPELPDSDLPIEDIFQPVMANLSRAILLCHHNEAYANSLIADRDRARSGQARFRAALDTSDDIVFLIDPQAMTFLDFNQSAESQTGYAKADLLGMGPHDLSPATDPAKLAARFGELAAHSRDSVELDAPIRRKDGSEFLANIRLNLYTGAAGEKSVIAVARDITERRQTEAISYLFHEVDRRLLEGLAPEKIPAYVCERLAELFDYPLVWLGARETDGAVTVRAAAGTALPYLVGLSVRWDDTPEGRGPTGSAIRSGGAWAKRPGGPDYAPWHERAKAFGIHASVALPVRVAGETFGALNLYARHADAFEPQTILRLEDVAARVGIVLQIALNQQRLRLQGTAMEAAANAIFITDRRGLIEWVNPAFSRLSGHALAEVVGKLPSILRSGRHDAAYFEKMWRTILAGQVWSGEIVNRRADGSLYVSNQTVTPTLDEKGEISHFISIQEDVTAKKETESRLRYMQEFDVLTGLPNRAMLLERLGQALAQAARTEALVAVLQLDLDRFKNINDTLGQAIGNRLLQEVSGLLESCMSAGDTVSRQGGDEFAAMLTGLGSSLDAALAAQRILDAFARPIVVDGHDLFVTPSIGIALYPLDGIEPNDLLKDAEAAMFRTKEQGGNGYQFFTADMTARTADLLELESSMRKALEQNEFLLHYQPQVDLASGEIIGVEALARWLHPERGLIPPARFIPVAEETGLILPLGAWVLHTACAQAKAWQDAGHAPIRMAVNLSARQFRKGNLIALVDEVLQATGLAPQWLELEITESAMMEEPAAAAQTLGELKKRGIQIAIDDFGTGYSSLSQLKRFPLDKLKLDQSFVREIPASANDEQIALAIISMARSLKLKVIAEGVETEEQLAFLSQHGCDEIQGYYFSRPVPPEELARMLDKRQALAVMQ
ncbi:MAG: EAL domain-containing protein [Sulfuricella sp.]|nr:EAL domain-containing protein [Sulfuricella sp.]